MYLSLHTFKPGEGIRLVICKTKPLNCFINAFLILLCILPLLIDRKTGLRHVLFVGKAHCRVARGCYQLEFTIQVFFAVLPLCLKRHSASSPSCELFFLIR